MVFDCISFLYPPKTHERCWVSLKLHRLQKQVQPSTGLMNSAFHPSNSFSKCCLRAVNLLSKFLLQRQQIISPLCQSFFLAIASSSVSGNSSNPTKKGVLNEL